MERVQVLQRRRPCQGCENSEENGKLHIRAKLDGLVKERTDHSVLGVVSGLADSGYRCVDFGLLIESNSQ